MGINLEDQLDAENLAALEMLPGDLLDPSDLPAARATVDELTAHLADLEIPDSAEVAGRGLVGKGQHR